MFIWFYILSTYYVVNLSAWIIINYSWCAMCCSRCAFYLLSIVLLYNQPRVRLLLLQSSKHSENLCSLCSATIIPTTVLGRRCKTMGESLVHSLIIRLVSRIGSCPCRCSSSALLPSAKVYPIAVLCSYSTIGGNSYMGGFCLNGVLCIDGVLLVYVGFICNGGLLVYGGSFSIGGSYSYSVLYYIMSVSSINSTFISYYGGAADGITSTICVTIIHALCLCYQRALHSALYVIIIYVICHYMLIIMSIINYNINFTINDPIHDSSVHIYPLVQSLFMWMNYITSSQSTTVNNYLHVLWYNYIVCATLQSTLQSTLCWLVLLIYLITCNYELIFCLINLGFSGAIHVWQPTYTIQQAFSFICNPQTINLQSLEAVTTAICSNVYFILICAELKAKISYFNIYESQGETCHVEERIRCQRDSMFHKKFCNYNYPKCSRYRPWIETAPDYNGSSHNKLSETNILSLISLRNDGEFRSQIKFARFGLAFEELLLGKLLPLMPNIFQQIIYIQQPLGITNIIINLIPAMDWFMAQWTATSARSWLGVGSIRVMLNF